MTENSPIATERAKGHGLFVAALAAILASTCCLGPLLLLLLGVSGAWIATLTLLEPFRLYFIALSAVVLAVNWRRIWRPVVACAPDAPCARPGFTWLYKIGYILVVILLFIGVGFPWIAPWFY